MVVANVATELQETSLALFLVIHPCKVTTDRLCRDESTAPTAGIIGVAEDCYTPSIHKASHSQISKVTVFCSIATFNVTSPALAHTFFDGQVKHRFFLTVIDTCHTCVVALTFISSHLADHTGLQVLEGRFRVAAEEFLLVDKDALHLLTVNLYGSFLGDLCAWELLQQGFKIGTSRNTECISIIDKGVGPHFHLSGLSCNNGIAHQLGVVLKNNLSEQLTAVLLGKIQRAENGLVPNIRSTKEIVTNLKTTDTECSVILCGLSCNLGTVESHDDHGGTWERFARIVNNSTCNSSFLCAGSYDPTQCK